ncbi:hypothetical protein HNP24_001618 [Chryseobacterium sediminis]|uniref:Peptidase M12B domain-containing protein n=1 Tax=Chryseobacterium sediminis TaxID=1679494 RepID=A0ABR6PY75_9FLAO|nr:hypothetical protein [Chryseobacterium sediminis]MBB6330668.1 hypothetical protein [Chryseobacterium sediminis]
MKKQLILSAILCSLILVSCNSENQENDLPESTVNATVNGSVHRISELPLIPEFAKPIEKAGEVRKFTLIKNDGTKLNFVMTSAKATLFGKMRTLAGTVSTDLGKEEKAVMLVSENGFELLYTDHDQNFLLKGNEELNIGYKKHDFTMNSSLRQSFLAFTKKNGVDGNQILSNLNRKRINNDSRYQVAVEKSNHYTLINETATMRKRESTEGKSECPTVQLPFDISTPSFNKTVEADPGNYNIEIMHMDDTYNFDQAYLNLGLSLYSVDNDPANLSHMPTIYQYQIPDEVTDPDQYFEYIVAVEKQSDSGPQLNNLRNYCNKYPTQIISAKCALYEDGWGSVLGSAWVGTYSSGSYSTLIACDNSGNVLAHECGHNLGAAHVNSSSDVMYKYASSNLSHFDAANIAKIKAKL